jgi:hypothetical protein
MALTRLGLNQSINLASNVTGTLATGNGGTGATSFAPGKILQVLNVVSSTETVVSNNTYTDVGLSLAITPTSTSNKILCTVFCNGVGKFTNNTFAKLILLRGSTTIVDDFAKEGGNTGDTATNKIGTIGTTFLDSPSSTSAQTYKVQMMSGQNNASVQCGASGAKSTLTLMEISA